MRRYYVSLEEMLDARERRAFNQREMLDKAKAGSALISFTLNIPGEYKRTPLTALLFDRGMKEIDALGFSEVERRVFDQVTGSEALILVEEDSKKVKALLEEIEESFPAARLFDLDVIDLEGEKLSRSIPRRCLLCDRPAHECARSRAHGLEAVQAKVNELLEDFAAKALGEMGVRALRDEIYTTPKPGLVDEKNNGAHKDMDLPLFEKSIDAISSYLEEAAALGIHGVASAEMEGAADFGGEEAVAPADMDKLRTLGIDAEQKMFSATEGVNTHKGIIYSMGLLLYGMGRELIEENRTAVEIAADLARVDGQERLKNSLDNPSTNGGKVYSSYGIPGAVGEAIGGFKNGVKCAENISKYLNQLGGGADLRMAGALALIDSMRELEDTNLIHRGGPEGLSYVREESGRISALSIEDRIEEIYSFDEELIKRNLSPGGSADMLALGYLIREWNEKKGFLFKLFQEGEKL